jgi:caspase domain-containing protein
MLENERIKVMKMKANKKLQNKFLVYLLVLGFMSCVVNLFAGDASGKLILGEKRALLIGNNNYQSKKWPDLRTAIRDVEVLSDVLQLHYGYKPENMILLKDARRQDILSGFSQLARISGPNDTVMIYYGGHGEFDKNNLGWWVPVKAEEDFDYISNEEILTRLRIIKAKHKLLVSDSCFSGNLLTRSISETRGLKKVKTLRKQELISDYVREKMLLKSAQGISSGGNEPVGDGGAKWGGHSIFAYHLIAQLKANQKKYMSADVLGNLLVDYVSADTTSLGTPQTPDVRPLKNQRDQGGEFFFVKQSLGGPIDSNPVLIVFLKSSNDDFQNHSKKALLAVFDEMVDTLQRNGFKTMSQPVIVSRDQPRMQMRQKMEELKAQKGLLININVELVPNQTLMWKALLTIKTKIQAYEKKGTEITSGSIFKLKDQRLPLREWLDESEYKTLQYENAANKLITRYSKTDVAAYIRSFFM